MSKMNIALSWCTVILIAPGRSFISPQNRTTQLQPAKASPSQPISLFKKLKIKEISEPNISFEFLQNLEDLRLLPFEPRIFI